MDQVTAEERQRWIEYFIPLAEQGDPDAQLAVGIGYANGVMVEKDLMLAELWLRRAEEKKGEEATFVLIKTFSREESPKTLDIFAEKAEWELGAIYLICGRYLMRNGDVKRGRLLLKKGWEKGNIIAGISFISSGYGKPWRFFLLPVVLPLLIESVIVKAKDQADERILE
ncbi:sel1 repeat family protein [Mesorhizobium sp. M7A.F.Ca.US.014.04.1.1]|uniref:sel1 repeat family protein n=2 Tax=Phyllobacteriaceae TaxID=69277 RepID=UPI0007A93F31|nr:MULTISPECIES: sel1 repeat family protein [Mesorhizobium]AMX93296.1 hypothetical protein A4R28_09445 [Mesorhizobium ciceri]MDF3207964.1 sel1 repeat family protein [Mesorhizobium sp. LMG15046]MDF3229464.1 sel1 repeat family protein [Mesorhizobium sp. DSM 30133]RUU22562.1 sel1 repeat family protein [Mesorhizobium sp. Primo-B]RUU35904.1 sel1 repeat family protein [Mesorhizobium sp. Primo-A]